MELLFAQADQREQLCLKSCAHQLEFCTDGVGASELRVMLEGSSVTRPFVTIFGRYFDDECYHHAYFLDNSLKLTPLSDTN